jgi:hypothetical protein
MSIIPAALLAAGFVFGGSSAEARVRHGDARTTIRAHANQPSQKTSPKTRRKSRPESPVADSTSVELVAVEVAPVYGPYLPLEAYEYPRPPCTEYDAVVEAHVHEMDEDTPESADVARTVGTAPSVSPITRVARTLGSFLRPKSAQSTVRPEDVDLSDLLSAGVQIPVEGVDASRLQDSFLASRGKHRQHLAIDIGAAKGTPVLAAADGEVVQLRREKRGGTSLYQKDATGRYLLFYCHLNKYVPGMRSGQKVAKGEVIAYVGRTGHVIGGPHLHFSITRLPEDDNFKAGVAINPYLLFLAAVP